MWLKCGVFLLVALFANQGEAGNCNMPDESDWNTALRFPVKEKEFDATKVYKIQDIIDVEFNFQYVKHNLDTAAGTLTFSLIKEEFEKYVENEESNQIDTTIKFVCSDGTSENKGFTLLVTQTDIRKPEIIGKENLEFLLKMPILPNTLIPAVEIKFSEKNLDVQPNDINFLVSGSCAKDFEFDKTVKDAKKVFKATLKSKDASVKLDQPVTCDIEVNSSNGKDEAKMLLNVDIKDSIPPNPQFEESLYTAVLQDNNKILDIEIKLLNQIFDPTITWDTDVYKDHFNFDKATKTFSSIKALPSDAFNGRNFITVKIEATYDKAEGPGRTVIIISPKDTGIREIPEFVKPLYVAQYENPNQIIVEDIELKSVDRNADFVIHSDDGLKNNFHFANNKLTVTNLPETVFKDKNSISITIEATYKNVPISDKTVVIINGPEKIVVPIPVFEKPLYETQYEDANTINIEDILLESTEIIYPVTYDIIADKKEYFEFDNHKLKIHNLPESEFDDKNYISVKIIATYDYKGVKSSGKTVVIIKPPDKIELPIPVFVKSLYEGQYEDENNLQIEDIKLDSADPNKKVDFKIISEHKAYFTFDNDKLKITGLPKTVFDEKNFILITIEANYKGEQATGKTNVLINGPKEIDDNPIPVFVKSLYEGQYEDENNLQIEDIKLDSADPNKKVDFKIISEHQTYFTFDNDKLKITGLPKTVFDEKNFILITIEANYKGEQGTGKTNVLINGPKEIADNPIPVFVKSLYEGQYEDENNLQIEDIKLDSADPNKKVDFKIISEHEAYFTFYNDKLKITGLPKTVFDEKNYILITIEANYKGEQATGKTNVLINGPKEIDDNPIPVFVKSLYEGQYEDENNLQIEDIKLDSADPNKKVDFKIISEHKAYFTFDNDKLKITGLPKSVFDEQNYILITIEANYKGEQATGKTNVLINGPKEIDDNPIPVFVKSLYEGQYEDENNLQIEDIKLDSVDPNKKVDFKIISEHQTYFTFDNDKLKITGLPKTVFDEKNFILITIEANYKGEQATGKTNVLINGPKEIEDNPIPVFVKSLYEAQYESKDKLTVEDIKLVFVDPDHTIEYKIVSEHEQYFKFNNNKLTIQNLPESVFDNNYILVTIEAKYKDAKNSGKTTVLINGPIETEIPTASFKKPFYDAKYVGPTTIEHDDILLNPTSKPYNVDYKIISVYEKHFKFDPDTHKLTVTDPLSEDIFDDKNFISVTIQATYKDASSSGFTVVIINAPDDLVLEFKKPLYEAQYKDKDTITVEKIELKSVSPGKTVSYEILTDINENYFSFDINSNELKIHSLPATVFDGNNFISIKIQATYVGTAISGETVVIINGPEKTEIPTAVFEKPSYDAKYKGPINIEHEDILLNPTSKPYNVDYKIISVYEKHFKFDPDTHKLTVIDPLSEDMFKDKNFISVTIQATYKDASSSGYTVVIINSPKSSDTKQKVYFDKQADVLIMDSPITGFVGIYKALSDDSSEKIIYSIDKSSISNLFEYNSDGILSVTGNLPAQPYYQITLGAKGENSKSEAKMDVILIDKKETNIAGFKFENRLEVHNVLEESEPTVIVPMLKNHKYNIVDDNSEGWFEIDKNNGNLIVNKIDREDLRFKDMLVVQVKTKIQAEEIKQLSTKYNKLQYGLKQFRKQDYCIDITNIPNSYKEMYVVVTIEDINDHDPVFIGDNPLTIGYPSLEIAEYVAPPYLVKVEATDEDIGMNAKIRYSVDKTFKIDPEKGIIYPSENLSSDTEFTVTATDKDGADDGRSTSLKIKVKILKEEHITIITTNDIAYNEVDKFIENLSKETKTTVKYLSSTALPKSEETRSLRLTKDDDKIPLLKIVLYAFDKDEIVSSSEFRKKIEDSNIGESVKVTEYESPEKAAAQDEDESSDSGWIAAVSTLSVLLALVIFGVIGFYIFYLRPKLYGGPIRYEKHSDEDSTHMAPVELKMESSRTIDRRPTGFPVGFNPTDLDDEEDEDDLESVKEEVPTEEVDEGINESEVSSTNEPERKKSVVKFDVNVTEIEISEL